MSAQDHSRRNFITKAAITCIAATGLTGMESFAADSVEQKRKTDHLNFLFQGDSITDGNRGRSKDPNHIMGHGYAFSIASRVGAAFPEKANQFYNRGISGNTVIDLAKRWQTDTLNLKPDVLSILIGINDTDSVIRQQNIVQAGKYEEGNRSLLKKTTAEKTTGSESIIKRVQHRSHTTAKNI